MKIAFDIDNVLADIVGTAREILECDLGLEPGQLEMTGIYDAPYRVKGHEKPISVDHAFWGDERVLLSCVLFPGALEAVTMAADIGVLAGYVTRRPESARVHTAEWRQTANLPDATIAHVGTDDPATNFDTCKSHACIKLGATHLIDDHADEFLSAHAAGISMVVVDAVVGRAKRHQILADHPDVPLVPSALAAMRYLLPENTP